MKYKYNGYFYKMKLTMIQSCLNQQMLYINHKLLICVTLECGIHSSMVCIYVFKYVNPPVIVYSGVNLDFCQVFY